MKSYLLETRYFRYLLPHKAPADKDLIYFPYWRFKGMLFWCLPGEIQNRFLDLSHQAVDTAAFPISLGLRGQAMKLKFVTPDTPGRFITPSLPFQVALDTYSARFHTDFISKAAHEARIGESVSLIYAPFYIEDRLYDAVLNRPVATDIPEGFDVSPLLGKHPGATLRFIPTLCPKCGWDLEGQRDSLALACANCGSLWQTDQGGLKELTVSYLPDDGESTIYLPFWRIKAAVSGLSLGTYADLARLANLPLVIRPEWEENPFYFWAPAFKVRPESYLRLFTHITTAQPLEKLTTGLPNAPRFSVSMPLKESMAGMMVALANLIKPRRAFVDNIDRIQVIPQSFRLAYLPFQDSHHEYIQPRMNLAVNKNQLILAKNL
ncbi:MAG: hypothetical protein V2B19_11685 [Pseudomonadota bacterium]